MHSPAYAAPQGGQVSAGQATISQQQLTTDIHQSSQNAVINWQKFDIQPNETVNFHQPNAESITLNRVVGNEESAIRGAINANGNVFISNPNGVLIGKEAQINVGSLVATTQNIKDDDLMNNRLNFNGQAGGKVENNANIRVPKGGVIALIAPIVKNSGKLTASEGVVLLASAEQFRITLPKDNFSYTLDRGTLQGLVDNKGAILADGGRVVLTAKGIDAVKKSVIKHSGTIEANTVSNKNGVVELLGDLDHSELQMTGSIKAEGKGTQQGGQVETSAAKLKISEKANVSTKSEKGKTGKWTIDPKDFTVATSSGDMSGQAVSNALKNNNVELKSRNGAKEGKGDVIINDEISWDKNTLTLNAENDIHINKTLNGSGTAKLALEYGQGSDDGGEADYYLDKNTPIASRTVKVNLPEGKNFTTQKGSKGKVVEYEVIHQMPEIVRNNNERNGTYSAPCEESCEQWKSAFTASNIAFGKDIDLSHTANYQGFAGWDVPKNDNNSLPVRIEGLGHQADNLTLASKKNLQPTGLFTRMHNGLGTIRNIGVTNMNISSEGGNANAGGLVGIRGKNISNSYATGSVATSGEDSNAGGLVGFSAYNITNSYATGSVTTSGKSGYAGGLVGHAGSNITNSYALGSVTTSGHDANAGGVLGRLYQNGEPNITNTYFNVNQVSSEKGEVSRYGTGVSEQALKQKTTFENWDFDTVWRIDEGRDYPRLRALTEGKIEVTPEKTEAGITANNLSKTYDGEAVNTEADLAKLDGWNGTGYTVSGLKEGDSVASIFNGRLTFNGAKSTWKGAVNAGEYVLDPTADLTEAAKQKYEIVWNTGKLTINKRPISLIGTKEYNGNPLIRAKDFIRINGLVEKDKAQAYDSKNKLLPNTLSGGVVTTGIEVREEAYRLKDTIGLTLKEELAKNYEIDPEKSMVFVSPTTLKMNLSLHGHRQYDGTKDAVVDENTVLDGKFGSDDVSLVKGGKGILKSENAGKQPLVDLGTIALTGSKAKNYKLTTEGSYWDIAKKPLVVQALDNYEFVKWGGNPISGFILDKWGKLRYEKGNSNLVTRYGVVANGLVEKDKAQISSVNVEAKPLHQHYDALIPSNLSFKNKALNSNYDITYQPGRLLLITDPNKVNNGVFNIKSTTDGRGNVIYTEPDGLSNYYKDLNQHLDELYLAETVYNRDFQPDSSQFQLVTAHDSKDDDGLQMALYRKGEQYFIAFRGTEFSRWNDIKTDLGLWKENVKQQKNSLEVSKQWLKDKVPANARITLVGHSLGGNLAQYIAIGIGRPVNLVTFNSAPFLSNNGVTHPWVTPMKDIYAKHFVFDSDGLQQLSKSDYLNLHYYPTGKTKINFLEHGGADDHRLGDIGEVVRVISSLHKNYEVLNSKENSVIQKPFWFSTYQPMEDTSYREFKPKPEEHIQIPKLEPQIEVDKLPPLEIEDEGICAKVTLSEDICNNITDSLIKSGVNKVNATLMTKAVNSLMSNMMSNLESTQEIREFFGKFPFFDTNNFMNQMRGGMTKFTSNLVKTLEEKSKTNIGFKPTLLTMKDIATDAFTKFVQSEVKSQVLEMLPKEGKLKYFSPVVADIISSVAGNIFSELAKGKVNIDPEKVLLSFVKSSTKELKKHIVSSLISEENYFKETVDFIGEIAVEAINSFAKAAIKNKGISAKTIAQFETEFTVQLAMLSAKEVWKNVEIGMEINSFEKDFMRQQASSIMDKGMQYQRYQRYQSMGDTAKANASLANYQALGAGYNEHIDLKPEVVTNIDMKLARAYLKLEEFRVTRDVNTELEIREIMKEIEPYAASQAVSGQANKQGVADKTIGRSFIGHGISTPMDYYSNMADLLGLGGYRSSELKAQPKTQPITIVPNLSGQGSLAPQTPSLNIR